MLTQDAICQRFRALNISVFRLAKDSGVPWRTVRDALEGRRKPTQKTLDRLATALDALERGQQPNELAPALDAYRKLKPEDRASFLQQIATTPHQKLIVVLGGPDAVAEMIGVSSGTVLSWNRCGEISGQGLKAILQAVIDRNITIPWDLLATRSRPCLEECNER